MKIDIRLFNEVMPWNMDTKEILVIKDGAICFINNNDTYIEVLLNDFFFYCKEYAETKGFNIMSTKGESIVKEHKKFNDDYYIKNDNLSEIECVIKCVEWIINNKR